MDSKKLSPFEKERTLVVEEMRSVLQILKEAFLRVEYPDNSGAIYFCEDIDMYCRRLGQLQARAYTLRRLEDAQPGAGIE